VKSSLNVWPLLVGVSLLYIGGMILNDVCDVAVDHRQRPQRPLPSGRVSRNAALAVTIAMGAGRVGLGGDGRRGNRHTRPGAGWCDCGLRHLAQAFGVERAAHGRVSGSGVLAGHGVGAWQQFMSAGSGSVLPIIMTAYTVFITIAARGEASDQPTWQRAGRIVAWLMLLTPLGVLAVIEPVAGPWKWPLWMTLPVVVVWLARSLWLLTRRQPRIGRAVEGYLAGFCLVDGLLLLRLDLPYAGLAAGALFGLTLLAHRWIKGT
jgi:hypothetical protein